MGFLLWLNEDFVTEDFVTENFVGRLWGTRDFWEMDL